jgi:flagellar motor switch protein FliM
MSSFMTNKLSRKNIQKILQAAGKSEISDSTDIQTEEFRWDMPHYFNATELEKLNQLIEKITIRTAEQFCSLYQTEFDVSLDSMKQYFGEQALDKNFATDKVYYYAAFSRKSQSPCGMIVLDYEAAKDLTAQLLGGETEGEEEKLSELEESILVDISESFIKALNKANRQFDFEIFGGISKNTIALKIKASEPMCEISMDIKKKDSEKVNKVPLLIASRELQKELGSNAVKAQVPSQQQIKKAIQERLKEMKVDLRAELDNTLLRFEDVMNLQTGDILVLDKNINQSIEISAEGFNVCSGKPVECSGNYGVLITEMKKV